MKMNQIILQVFEKITLEQEVDCQKNVQAVTEQYCSAGAHKEPLRMVAFDQDI